LSKSAKRQIAALRAELAQRDTELLGIAQRAAQRAASPAALAKAADSLEAAGRLAKAAEDSRLREYLDGMIAATTGSARARYETAREALDRP
jgi:hypothetical protein